MKTHGMLRDILDRAVETGVPFVVRKRCTPHQLACWLAIRALMDLTERTAFGSREIADEMGTSAYPRVTGWLTDLVALNLLEIVGYEEVKGGKFDRPIYRIPWESILDASNRDAQVHLAKLGTRNLRKPSGRHELQTEMDLTVIDRSRQPLSKDHGDRDRSITDTVIDRSRQPLSKDHGDRDRSITLEGRKEGRKEGDRARAKKQQAALELLPPNTAPPPPPPEGEPPLPAHPVDLWRDACPHPRPLDLRQLAAMALAHNESTGGHGLYWVGRAILAVAISRDIRSVKAIRSTLDRWRDTASYGSDTPAYERRKARQSHEQQDTADRPERPADDQRPPKRPHGGDGRRGRGYDRPPRAASSAAPVDYDALLAQIEAAGPLDDDDLPV